MQSDGTIPLGTKRDYVCARCTNSNGAPRLRQHIYRQHRSRGRIEFFWECYACGYLKPVSTGDDFQEQKVAPETERLHAQWREDNDGLMNLRLNNA
jgi:hypothetical protein